MAKTPTESALVAELDPRRVLDAAIDGARLASPLLDRGDRQFAFVPDGYKLENISDPLRLPSRVRQGVTLDDAASTIAFVNRFSGSSSVLIADFNSLSIRAVLDFHGGNQGDVAGSVGACDFTATFALLPSEEFSRWNAFEGSMHDQAAFAEFLEENATDICAPEPATMVEISRDLEATTNAAFRARTRLENGDRAFTYETETKVKGDLVVPTKISLCIPLFNGEEPEIVEAMFRFRPQADGLKLGLFWHRVEYRRRAQFNLIAHRIAEETGVPVFAGRAAGPGGVVPR
jgi:uncharacterized protein YfdQ (DUF2303 family)